jgi:hypothetical protein
MDQSRSEESQRAGNDVAPFPSSIFSRSTIQRAIDALQAKRSLRTFLPVLLLPAFTILGFLSLTWHEGVAWFRALLAILGGALAAATVAAVVRPTRRLIQIACAAQFAAALLMLALGIVWPGRGKAIFAMSFLLILVIACKFLKYQVDLMPLWRPGDGSLEWVEQQVARPNVSDNDAHFLSGDRGAHFRLFAGMAFVVETATKRLCLLAPGELELSTTEVFNYPEHLHVAIRWQEEHQWNGHMLISSCARLGEWNVKEAPAADR